MNQNTAPSPQLFWETITAFQRSAAIKAAVELDVFTKIAEGNKTESSIAEACGAQSRGIRILCDTMTVMGFLTKENGEYDLNEMTAAFLDRRSPMYLGGTIDFILSPMQQRGFDDLTNAVRQGGSTVTENASLSPDSEMWVKFARGMTGMMMPAAQMMAENLGFEPERKFKVLDIAAGHGIFGITIAQKYRNAEIYALDWANVLHVATENARKFGVADRHHTIPGSAFDVEFGDNYDVVLLTNFLHHFDRQTCEDLLKKIHQSLNADGKVLTLEFVPNDDRVSPPSEAMFALVMLAATPAGDAYTFAELRGMFETAGFSRSEHIPLAPLPQHLIVSMK
ncbi:MAG TPA: class I SAM-dependent methyltransferase [Pyrinomonadaceae bacterium]|jgi:2-polyprenyl-3-methyl-5-hydroxy-6-metoxy-1,4-benzoquinol methylase